MLPNPEMAFSTYLWVIQPSAQKKTEPKTKPKPKKQTKTKPKLGWRYKPTTKQRLKKTIYLIALTGDAFS
jgi:hypothetical protein